MMAKDRVYITWMAIEKCNASLSDIMKMFKCKINSAEQYYKTACKKWKKRPYEIRTKDIGALFFVDRYTSKMDRPPSAYSNKNWSEN